MPQGRLQLLNWINSVAEAQYSSIEMLGDCIAYCQILEFIHPGTINLPRLNLNTRYPDDCVRNSKILQDGLKRMKITQPACLQKAGRGKFQDNIIFIQWLYTYVDKNNKFDVLEQLNAYERRLLILQKQNKHPEQMNVHLIPNASYNMQQNDQINRQQEQEYGQEEGDQQMNYHNQIGDRVKQINQYVMSLEKDLMQKMEFNWRLMHFVQRSIQQRNTMYNLLRQIEQIAKRQPESESKTQVLKILYQTPQDFL